MAELQLIPCLPATMRMGLAAVDSEQHGWCMETGRGAFVTPELDGWTLVLGTWFNVCRPERAVEIQESCLRLSARYGAAHAYVVDLHYDDVAAWLIAENGEMVRFYRYGEPPADVGTRLPVEQALLLPHEESDWWAAIDWDAVDESFEFRETCYAGDIADALSVNPAKLGPYTVMRGHGVLALTPSGVDLGVSPAMLPL
jgi:hypothetical protein